MHVGEVAALDAGVGAIGAPRAVAEIDDVEPAPAGRRERAAREQDARAAVVEHVRLAREPGSRDRSAGTRRRPSSRRARRPASRRTARAGSRRAHRAPTPRARRRCASAFARALDLARTSRRASPHARPRSRRASRSTCCSNSSCTARTAGQRVRGRVEAVQQLLARRRVDDVQVGERDLGLGEHALDDRREVAREPLDGRALEQIRASTRSARSRAAPACSRIDRRRDPCARPAAAADARAAPRRRSGTRRASRPRTTASCRTAGCGPAAARRRGRRPCPRTGSPRRAATSRICGHRAARRASSNVSSASIRARNGSELTNMPTTRSKSGCGRPARREAEHDVARCRSGTTGTRA